MVDIINWFLNAGTGIYNQFVEHPFDTWSFVIFIAILSYFCIKNKEKLVIQKMAGYALYIIMYRTKVGLKLMDNLSEKYRELIKLLGYICIGLGFAGMLFICINIILMLVMIVMVPGSPVDDGASLILPFTNMPGVGYLSFWYWVISLFIIVFIHEFAHGVVARAHKVKVKSSGLAIFGVFAPIIPAAFVEPDEKELAKANDVTRYSIYAAGPMINIVVAIILLMFMPYVGKGILFMDDIPAPFEDRFAEEIGVSYVLVNPDSAALAAGMGNDTIINRINDEDVNNYNDLVVIMGKIKPESEITIGTDKGDYQVTTSVDEDNPNRALIGINNVQNEKRKRTDVQSWKVETFFWLKGLFKWLFILNFAVGFMNLLPMGPVDGGQMSRLAMERIFKNKKRAMKIWGGIGLFLFGTLILAILVRYFGNPFALLH